jgi:hypothetical protein
MKINLTKKQFSLVFRKVFFLFLFWLENTFQKLKKNILFFVNYIKFGPQSFDCYNFFLKFHSVEFDLILFLYQF